MSPAQLLEINIDWGTRKAGMIKPGRSIEVLTIDSRLPTHAVSHACPVSQHQGISNVFISAQQFVVVLLSGI